MKHSGLLFFHRFLILAAAITLACGSSPKTTILPNCGAATGNSNAGQPQSITLCPATADAQEFGGQVQYVATGYYTTQPSPVTPIKPGAWGACQQNAPTTEVSVSDTGLARCESGASGTYQIFASDGTECLVIGPCGTGCQVSGYAQLTCP